METARDALVRMRDVLLETWAANDAMNQLILASLDPDAWRARPPAPARRARTIAAIFSHIHNTRVNWLRKSAPHLERPDPLNPNHCSMREAAAAHRRSAKQCLAMLTDALSGQPERRVTKFSRDAWMPVWPAGGAMFTYMFAHEAHHRGQILMLAHQLGYRIPVEIAAGVWNWDKLWKHQGFARRPR